MTTKTRSERAIELLKQLVLHTEPGGAFYWDGQPSDAVREDFMAEVIGVVTGTEEDVGRTPPEILNEVASLTLRTLRDDLLCLLSEMRLRGQGDPAFAMVVNMGTLIDGCLHNLGSPENLRSKRPTIEEFDALMARGAGCNCQACRMKRAEKAAKKK